MSGHHRDLHVLTHSFPTRRSSVLVGRYDIVNIKLDKTGGLTEAVRLLRAAQAAGLDTMVGCMMGTSLAMAPALLLAPHCRFVALAAPLLMGRDSSPALVYRDGLIVPPPPRSDHARGGKEGGS